MRGRWLARAPLTISLGIIVWVGLSLAQEAAADNTTGQGTGQAGQGSGQTADRVTGPVADTTGPEGHNAGPHSTVTAGQLRTDCDHGGPYLDEDVWVFTGARLATATFEGPTGARLVGTCAATVQPSPTPDVKALDALPQTGADVGAMVALGLALVVTGVLLLLVRRKRPTPVPPKRGDDRVVWTHPV